MADAEYVRCEAVGPYQVEYPMAGERKVGGPIRTMEWDQNGERLVVTFSGDEEGRELIALYVTRLHPFLQFSPRYTTYHSVRLDPALIEVFPFFKRIHPRPQGGQEG
jgi:hypothetical protein